MSQQRLHATRTTKRAGRVEREDLLLASISLVKDGRRRAGPADFVNDVAFTFQSLAAETRRYVSFQEFPATAASIVSCNMLQPGRHWRVAS
jgi:hypothetical protein